MMKDRSALSDIYIRSARFRKEREKSWSTLELLIRKAEKSGLSGLSYQEAMELNRLYQLTMNSLSMARAISMDKALLDYLDKLCGRAFLVVYAPQKSLLGMVSHFFRLGLPQAVRRSWLSMALAFLMMFLAALIGFALFNQDQSWYYTLVGSGLSDGRGPSASTEYLRSTIYDTATTDKQESGVFGSYLYSHNTLVAIFVFAIGVFGAAAAYILTFYNGLLLGAFFANFADRGLGYDLFAWLSIHGVTEISAICVACAAGTKLGGAVLMPGNLTRKEALRRKGKDATKLILLAMMMLIVAAILEGYFRQAVQSPEWRIGIGWGIGALWFIWLAFSGREADTHR